MFLVSTLALCNPFPNTQNDLWKHGSVMSLPCFKPCKGFLVCLEKNPMPDHGLEGPIDPASNLLFDFISYHSSSHCFYSKDTDLSSVPWICQPHSRPGLYSGSSPEPGPLPQVSVCTPFPSLRYSCSHVTPSGPALTTPSQVAPSPLTHALVHLSALFAL